VDKYTDNSEAVRAHLTITQGVIDRMATNSASCKAWCITLVSAILVIIADKGKPELTVIAAIPTVLFLILDTYYLSLERRFRASYNRFIDRLHEGGVRAADLYALQPAGSAIEAYFGSLLSFSIWPFYATLAVMILVVQRIVLK